MEVAKDQQQISDANPVFADYFKSWYGTYKIPGKSRTTVVRYETIYKKLNAYYGKAKLAKVTRKSYQIFMNEYGKKHAKDTVYKTNGSIRSCVRDGVADGIIQKDFTQKINLTWNSSAHERLIILIMKKYNHLKTPCYTI